MEYLPLFLNLKDRLVLVVGGSSVAFRKIQVLKKSGAVIKIVSRSLCSEIKEILLTKQVIWVGRLFQPCMLEGVYLVIVATDDSELNSMVFQSAEKRHIFINTVDDQSKCSCIFPAIVNRFPVLIGISSCGRAPVLVRILREKLELLLPRSIGYLARFAGIWRNIVKKRISDIKSRRHFWEKVFYGGHIARLIDQANFKEANRILRNSINTRNFDRLGMGNVVLVGAGPGDPGLITIRGFQAMQQADVILYDYLVNPEILDLARRDSNKICVGKRSGNQVMSQNELNIFIIKLAQEGKNVVRLKGGDSFIFGRGGEELYAISKAGISFQVVPGITAGIGAAAYAGIPLTHRKYSHSVTFITGHTHNNNNLINWKLLSDNDQTLIIYMGKLNIMNISKNLILHGRHIDTPVAIISRGTYPNQKILIGTLIELEKLVSLTDTPMLLIIGKVVSLHNEMHWFSSV